MYDRVNYLIWYLITFHGYIINVSLLSIFRYIIVSDEYIWIWLTKKNNDINKTKNTWEVSSYQHHQRQGGETSHGCGETRGGLNSGKGWFHTLKLTANAPENSPEPPKVPNHHISGASICCFLFWIRRILGIQSTNPNYQFNISWF